MKTDGLTIIEVLVSIVLILIIALTLFPTISTGAKTNGDSGNEQAISNYAKNVVETTSGYLLTPTTAGSDPYPNLTNPTVPTNLPAAPTGMTCTAPVVTKLSSVKYQGALVGSRVSIELSCTAPGQSQIKYYKEVGRPA